MKVKANELIDGALNWAVAKAEGHEVAVSTGSRLVVIQQRKNVIDYFDPAGSWGWGGPIIDRADIAVGHGNSKEHPDNRFNASMIGMSPWGVLAEGPTKLIAAMRCYVIAKLGDEVEVPDELVTS